ncbi:MAG: hypothetical protein ACI97N_001737 [Cognaticolwellia sp.]|jgi:hypothetical protein
MKKVFIAILGLCFINAAYAGIGPKPEKIYRITEVQKSGEYYIQQHELWKNELEKDKTNADAWYYYFVAARYANIFGNQNNDLAKIVTDVEKSIPNTFESHYLKYWSMGWTGGYFEELEAAYRIDPNRYETYHDFLSHYEMTGNAIKAQEFAQKWHETGMMSNTILSWSYNLLMSVSDDAIVVTHGDNDTYYPWVLQHVQGVQRGVKVVNINLLMLDSYRNKTFKDLGLPIFTKDMQSFNSGSEYKIALLEHLFDNSRRPVYLSQSTHLDAKKPFKDNLYLTGLASLYCKNEVDNVAMIKNNVENRFATDYLKVNLAHDRSETITKCMNVMYLESYLTLYKHYSESGESTKTKELKTVITKIAKEANHWDNVKIYFGQTDAHSHDYPNLNLKEIQKGFLLIRDNIWAGETELKVADYDLFLMDLVKNRDFETLAFCKTEKTDWESFLDEKEKASSDEKLFHHGHPDDANMPIQNISYEAAVAYSEWLTEVYNQSTYKKKKFQKVVFRLPTESEWELAAKGGLNADYPWGDGFYKNSKGCYLSNTDVANETTCETCAKASNDGGFFTVPADSYFPNNFGLYNVTGNVAEMIATKNIAKGGSWNDSPLNATTISKQNYTTPSPKIGVRIFMEVIEE